MKCRECSRIPFQITAVPSPLPTTMPVVHYPYQTDAPGTMQPRAVFDGLDVAGISFTLHWGQEGDCSPKRLSAIYGAAVDRWVAYRKVLLPDSVQRYMFSNDFLKRCGLSEAPALTGGGVIA